MLDHLISVTTIFGFLTFFSLIGAGIYYLIGWGYDPLRAAIDQEDAQRQAWCNSISGLKIQKNNVLLALQQEKYLAQQLLAKIEQWSIATQKNREKEQHDREVCLEKRHQRLVVQQRVVAQQTMLHLAAPLAVARLREQLPKEFMSVQAQEEYLRDILSFVNKENE